MVNKNYKLKIQEHCAGGLKFGTVYIPGLGSVGAANVHVYMQGHMITDWLGVGV